MPKDYPVAEIRTAIEGAASELFSEGMLSEKISQAARLMQLSGLDLYSTAVPWRISSGNGSPVEGFSETLRFAARDIHAYLVTFSKVAFSKARVRIEIDRARLPEVRRGVRVQGSGGADV